MARSLAFMLGCLVAASSPRPLPAQDTAPSARGSDSRGAERLLERYRDRLDLAPDQVDKVREILSESRQKQDEVRQQSEGRIRNVLTETQKTKFDEMQRTRENGGGGEGRTGGASLSGRWMGPTLDDLQRELDLTPEQREKVSGVLQSATDSVRQRVEEARANGFQGVDWQAVRSDYEKLFNETSDKVKGMLTAAQQEKYAKLLEDRARPFQGFLRRGEGASSSPADRAARAMEALKIQDAAEAEAIKALVVRVAQLQSDLSEFDRGARDKARGLLKTDGIGEEELESRLDGFRKDRRVLEDSLRKAQQDLGEVVSPRQELELLQLGILR